MSKIKENFKKNKLLILIFSIVWIVTIVLTLFSYKTTLGKESIGSESYNRSVVEINEKTAIINNSMKRMENDYG